MVDKFLRRPVLATVLSILIFLFGLLGLKSLPITQFPEIAPPMVEVRTNYMGANADAVLKSVIAPLEEQINGVENMSYIQSSAQNDGSANIKVYFRLGTNADMAAVNVQNRVAAATSKLPASVVTYGVTTEKSFSSSLLFVSLYSTNPAYNETDVQNYAKIYLYPEIQRVQGVGRVSIFGMRDYSMRVWLQPEKLAAYGLNPTDVIGAIGEQNIEAAPGKFGDNTGSQKTYTIKYKGKFTAPAEYENIVIKALTDGRILKLKDVAKVELGAFDYSVVARTDGYPSMALGVYQMAGSNARQIVNDVKMVLEKASESFPAGLHYSIPFDTNKFLDASISQVVDTFIEAFILVFIVVFLFLQDFKSTLIPGIASLVAIVGTFFFLMLFGFTLNILTLFAMVLAIGMVVDDAIVVVEAVHAKMHEGERDVKKATSAAMSEITGAIVSITFVMSAVFFPVAFMEGPTGAFYKQFALTLAVAVLISAVNALTLSPVLCVLFIKPPKEHDEDGKPIKRNIMKRFHAAFNTGFDKVTEKYKRQVGHLVRHKWIAVMMLLIFGAGTFFFIKTTPTGFIPMEDQGVVFGDVQLPAGTSRENTQKVLDSLSNIASTIPEITERLTITGMSLMTGNPSGSYGMLIISLKEWDNRERNVGQVIAELQAKSSVIKEGQIIYFVPPTVSGFGTAEGFEVQIQDKTGGSTERFAEVLGKFIDSLRSQSSIMYATTGLNINFPQREFTLNVDKCKLMGVNVSDVFNTLQAYYGSAQASDFNWLTKYYRVMVQADAEHRADESSLSKIMVRNNQGEMVPVSTFVTFTPKLGAVALNRFNLFVSATVTGQAKPGFSSGDAIAAVEKVAGETLPSGFGYEFSGMAREEMLAGGQSIYIFILCFVFVYLILAAQYESYILPWAVMISLIIGLFGVYFFVWLVGLDNNIYVQVALIMLIGLLAKNGILIVEFAQQRRNSGLTIGKAAKEAAVARLRPILMTSFAFIFGMVPLIRATGAGAAGNVSIGIAAAGGMLVGTLFGIFIIPVLFAIFRHLDEKVSPSKVPTTNKFDDNEK